MELQHQGDAVTIVEPGAMRTTIFDKAAASGAADGLAGSTATQRLYTRALAGTDEAMADMNARRDAAQLVMLRRFPQGVRDRLLMRAVGLRPDVFEPDEPDGVPASAQAG